MSDKTEDLQAEIAELKRQLAASVPESGFSMNWPMIDPAGCQVQMTARAPLLGDWSRVIAARAKMTEQIIKDGWQTTAAARTATPAPTAANGDGASGQTPCAMIEIGLTYTSKKIQLMFHCDGFEKPLTFAKGMPEMLRLLAPLGIGQEKIVVGKKIPIACVVHWQRGEKYTDVMSVAPAEKF